MAANKVKMVTELVDGLKECWPDFDITPNEFINPTLNSVKKIYERFIREFGIKLDTIKQNYQQFQDKEFEEIMDVYNLYFCTNRIYQDLELTTVDSFALSFTNIISPTDDKSLITRMSLLANYLYYCKSYYQHTLLPLKEEVLNEIAPLDDLTKEVHNILEELKTAVCYIVYNSEKEERLKSNNNQLKNVIHTTQLESEELDKKIQKLNAELKMHDEEYATLTESVEHNMKEKIKLESLVVDNYEAILVEQNKIEKELSEEEEQLSEHMKNIELKTEDKSNLVNTHKMINNFIENVNLQKLLDTYNLIEDIENEKEKIMKETQASQRAEDELRKLNDQFLQEEKELEEEFVALNLKSKNQLQTLESKISQLNKNADKIQSQLEYSRNNVTELNEQLKYVTNCCIKCTEEIENQNKLYETLYDTCLDAKASADEIVVRVLAQINEKMEQVTSKSAENPST